MKSTQRIAMQSREQVLAEMVTRLTEPVTEIFKADGPCPLKTGDRVIMQVTCKTRGHIDVRAKSTILSTLVAQDPNISQENWAKVFSVPWTKATTNVFQALHKGGNLPLSLKQVKKLDRQFRKQTYLMINAVLLNLRIPVRIRTNRWNGDPVSTDARFYLVQI